MFQGENRALSRTTSSRSFGPFTPPRLGTQAGALDAARAGWWVGAWLAFGFAIGLLLQATDDSVTPAVQVVASWINGVGFVISVGLAWLIWWRQPRWAVIVVLALLALNFIVSLLLLRISVSLIINGVLIYTTAQSARGAFRLAAFRNGRYTDHTVGDIFT